MTPKNVIDFVNIVDYTPAPHHVTLDFFQTRVDYVLHTLQKLPCEGILIVIPERIELAVFSLGLSSEHDLQRIECVGLFRGLLIAIPLRDLLLPKGSNDLTVFVFGCFGEISYLPELVRTEILIVSPGLYNFRHQQSIIIISSL